MDKLHKVVDSVGDSVPAGSIPEIVNALISAAADEVQAWYQYIAPAKYLVGVERVDVAETFVAQGKDELDDHFNAILNRLNELGADVAPLMNMYALSELTSCQFIPPKPPYNVEALVNDNIQAETCAIAAYTKLCELTESVDPVTYDLAKRLLAEEQAHLTALEEYKADFEVIHSLG